MAPSVDPSNASSTAHLLNGGAGDDTALIGRARADFSFTDVSNGTNLAAADGTAISLIDIEGRAFQDNSLFSSLGLGSLSPTLIDSDSDGRGDTQFVDLNFDGLDDRVFHDTGNEIWISLGNGGDFEQTSLIFNFGGNAVTGGLHFIDAGGSVALDLVFVDSNNDVWYSEYGTVWTLGTVELPAAPEIVSADTSGSVSEIADNAAGENVTTHSTSGVISFTDVNLAESHTVSVAAQGNGYLGSLVASVSDASTGDGVGEVTWNYIADDSALDSLAAGQTLTQSYDVTIDDGRTGTVTQTVSVDLVGANDAPTIAGAVNNESLYFSGIEYGVGQELYRVNQDGAVELVVDLFAGNESGFATKSMAYFNGALYFSGDNGTSGHELQRLDLATGDVTLISDLYLGAVASGGVVYGNSSAPLELTVFNNELYFSAYQPGMGKELHKLDGNGNVSLVSDMYSGTAHSNPEYLTAFNGGLYFGGGSDGVGSELNRLNSDGSIDVLTDLRSGTAGADPRYLTEMNGDLYFTAYSDAVQSGYQGLYRYNSDGSLDHLAQTANGAALKGVAHITEFNGDLYFSARGANGVELHKMSADGTVTQVADINPGGNADPHMFAELNGYLYFKATSNSSSHNIYRIDSDGSLSEHAALSSSISPADSVSFMEAFNGALYSVSPLITDLYRIGEDSSVNQVQTPVDVSRLIGTFGQTTDTTTDEDTALTLSFFEITDPDLIDTQTVTLFVADGALSLNKQSGLTFTDSNGSDGTLAFSGSLAAVNAAFAAGLVYDPTANFFGTSDLTISVDDGNGGTTSTTETITVISDGIDETPNEAPIIGAGDTSGSVTELADGAAGENITTHTDSGVISFSDADLSDNHTVSVSAQGSGYLGSITDSAKTRCWTA